MLAGLSEDQIIRVVQEAIEMALKNYKPSVSAEKGIEAAAKIIEEWVEKENAKNNIFSCELEINDYPTVARSKVMYKQYLESIYELTGCNVAIRGQFVEAGKKALPGIKKLQLYIQGNTRTEVASAYREIKKQLDEAALNYYTMGTGMNKFQSKYQI
jgi:hypothetical protein